ncbi:hypothetical protein FHS57_005171 [Runella defluvii]|uniref:Peptidase S74 domain-containing protein n=1 Tax=Runella defluvii TaxID=370973 RepID=A0A7W5ZQY3_9BACT|nr:tail fiber domain-containing protein [Runella defluvii]MBB3841150.1 hypothetical protein [Runella defluvii]
MNSQVILRRAYALAVALILSLLIGNKTVYSQSVTFTPNGVWLPSMTSNERITMPVTIGQLVFDTNTKSIWYHTGVGGDWKELITVKPSADNLGNHTATQNINVGDYFLSPDGLDRGLKVGREQLLLQLPKPRFQLGTNLATNSQINFANYTRNWAISTSQDRFEIVDSTFQTRPFIIEKNAFHNMLYIQEDKIGIGTSSPREKLDVAGKVKMNGFQLHNGTNTAGFILQSDAVGNGTWVNPAAAGFNYWTVANGAMFPNLNVNVGIGTEAPSSKLEVNGKLKATEVEIASTLKTTSIETSGTTKTTNFQLTNGATNGYILQSDANGNASWKSPSSLPISFSESDPKVGSSSRNSVPKWNGTKLTDGTMVDNGNIGIGVTSPTNKLEVAGTTKTTNLQLTNGATNGYILQSDASGNAVWKDPSSLPISFSETDPKVGALTNNVLPKWNGTKLTDGTMVDNGNIGIGVTSPTNKLEVAGTTKTTNLQLTNGATNGYILQSDASGNAVWKDPSSLPISFSETDPKVGALTANVLPKWNGTKLTDGTMVDNGNIGIGVTSPTNKLEVAGTTKTTNFQLTNGATNGYILQSDASGNAVWKDPSSLPISFSETDPKVGTLTNNVLPKWNGTKLTDGTMVDNGNIGIGVTSPTNKLEVAGTTKTTNFQLTNGATNGYILQSDASGNAVWKDPSSLPISFSETDPKVGTLTNNVLPKWNGTKLTDGTMVDNGNIGIGVTSPTNKLEVAGTTKTTNFQLTNGATNGYVLQSDAQGNAVWKNPTSLGITFTETDPKVGSQLMDYVPTWDGTKLVKGGIFDDHRGKIGILNDDPKAPLSVGKSYTTNLDAITYFNTSENKPVVIASIDNATPDNNKGIMIGEQGNEIQGRSGNNLTTNGDLILNAYDGNVGIGTTTPTSKLDVAGKIKSTDFQLTNGATNGYILQSDASGNGIWKDPSSLSISFKETDPKVGNQLTYFVPTWNGTQLVKGGIYSDVYGNVGILNTDPQAPFSVGESYTTNLNAITYINTAGNKPVVIANIDKAAPANNKGLLLGERGNEIQGRAGNSLITNSDLILNPYSGNVGVGTSSPTAKLEVNGNAKAKSIQLSDGAQNGYILQSDANGNASWANPSALSGGSTSWTKNGNNQYSNVTGNVGVGVGTPSQKIHLRGNLLVEHGRLLTYDSGKNVYVGEEVGGTDTTYTKGQHNTAIGANAFQNNTTGNNNVAVGRKALQSNTTGTFNTSIGTESLNSLVGGGFNVAIGPYSMVNNVDGNENVAVGNWAGFSNKGSGNVFLGNSAGSSETGSNKLYITNTSTSTPLIYGDFSKKRLVINDSLEAKSIKSTALQLTNGANVGYLLQSDASGKASWVNPSTLLSGSNTWTKNGTNQYANLTGNVGIGVSNPTQKLQIRGNLLVVHGRLLTFDSGKNVYVGEEVGGADTTYTTAQDNTALGANAFQYNTGGNSNVGIGRKALQKNTTGNANTAVGIDALLNNIQGSNSVALGAYALISNPAGEDNTAVGFSAGFANKGSGNVFIGNYAGAVEAGNNKLYIANGKDTPPLLYGDFATKKLVVNDSLEAKFLSVKMPNAGSYFPNATIKNQSVVTQIHVGNNANPKTRYYDKTNSPSSFFDLGINAFNYFSVDYNEATKFAVLPNGMVELSNNLKTFGKWITSDGDNEGIAVTNQGNVGINEVNSNVTFTIKSKMTTGGLFSIKDNNEDEKFYMSIKGNAGMGTSDLSKAKLSIVGSQLSNLSYGYLNNNGSTGSANSTSYYSLYTSDRIAASEFNAFSDARIKDIKGKSNNVQDLETLSKIEITDYQFKDKIGKGNGHHKKVIAQQVETVYPQAVSKTTDVIPDIYRLANIQNNFVELSNHQLTVGEKVKLIFGEKQEVFEVEAVNEKGFKIKNNGTSLVAATSVFVYGREVSDFRSVDYEALSTLNMSATQALLKRIEQLESENTHYKNEFKSFRTELEQLKAAVTGTNETKGK